MLKEEEDDITLMYLATTINQELLIKNLTKAHTLTCQHNSDEAAEIMRRPHDIAAILRYKNMDHEQLWLDCVEKLTDIISPIIEFFKMLPGFEKLLLHDKLLLIRTGCFQMCVLRMSRYIDPLTGYIIYGELMLPSEAFTTADTLEMKLVNDTFQMAKRIADLKLSESELALYSAWVVFSPDRLGLNSVLEVQTLNQVILKALKYELDQTHKLPYKGDVSVFDILIAQVGDLWNLSVLHFITVRNFMQSAPQLNFPPLYIELFGY